RLLFACHPRLIRLVEGVLTSDRPEDVENRVLPHGTGSLQVEKLWPCDVSFDTMAEVPPEQRGDRRWTRVEEQYGDYSIQGLVGAVKDFRHIDVLVHSIAYSPEIKNKQLDTSRGAYLQALSI